MSKFVYLTARTGVRIAIALDAIVGVAEDDKGCSISTTDTIQGEWFVSDSFDVVMHKIGEVCDVS